MALSPQDGDAKAGGSGATAQGGGKKKKKKNRSRGEPQPGGPAVAVAPPAAAAAAGGQNAHFKRPRHSGGSCPEHPTARHSAADCREIQKLAKRVSWWREQSSKDGSPPPCQRVGKEKASDSLGRRRGEGAGVPIPRSRAEGRLPRRRLRFRQRRPPQEAVRNVRRKLGACLPAGREDPSPRGPFGEAGGPEGGAAPQVEEHHHLLRAI